jgi:HPt (histidine-containing phosphotransfer) domain-containing protein
MLAQLMHYRRRGGFVNHGPIWGETFLLVGTVRRTLQETCYFKRPVRFMFSVNDKPTLDLSALASFRDFQEAGEPDFVTELIDLFIGDTTSQMELVRMAVANNNEDECQRLGHQLKGSSGNVGARRMASICEALENKDLLLGTAKSLLLELETEFELVKTLLNDERQNN